LDKAVFEYGLKPPIALTATAANPGGLKGRGVSANPGIDQSESPRLPIKIQRFLTTI